MPQSDSTQSEKERAGVAGKLSLEQYLARRRTPSLNQATALTTVAQAPRQSADMFRNTQAPVKWLPVELLANIFAFCALVDPISYVFIWNYKRTCLKPGWLNVTYVCAIWRRAALNYPMLWASRATNQFGADWLQAMLVRSKRVHVSLQVDFDRMIKDKASGVKHSELIAGHLSHISEIIFTKLPLVLNKDHFDFLRLSAPILTSVRTDVLTPCGLSVFHKTIPILPDDFVSQAPQLHRLHLLEHFPPLTTPVSQTLLGLEHLHVTFRTLKTMKIIGILNPDGPEARSFTMWSRVLGFMKKLKTLSLKYCLPWNADGTSTNNVVYHFPDLQSLEILDEVRDCGAFLQRLQIPAAAQVSVHCDTRERYGTFEEPWALVVSFVHAHLNAGSSPIQALSLTIPDSFLGIRTMTFSAVIWRSQVDFPATSCPTGFALALKLTYFNFYSDDLGYTVSTFPFPSTHPFMQALDTHLLSSVRTAQLVLQGITSWNLMHVGPLLHHIQAIETLCIAGSLSGHTAMGFLQPGPIENADASGQLACALPFPALKTLILWRVNLGAHMKGRDGAEVHCGLRAFLQGRRAAQGQFPTLFIRECTMKLEWWMGLQEVADVSWDRRDVDLQAGSFLSIF